LILTINHLLVVFLSLNISLRLVTSTSVVGTNIQVYTGVIMATVHDIPFVHRQYTNFSDIPFERGIDTKRYPVIHSSNDMVVERVKGKESGEYKTLEDYVSKSFKLVRNGLEEAKKGCLNEAKILALAQHKHVIKLFMTYILEPEDGDPWFGIIMDSADENLDRYLNGTKNSIAMEHIPGWFGCLLTAVDYIHGRGIRHRDIKPANILVKGSKVLLADFGISKMGLGKTMSTSVPGRPRARTTQYCAPEVEEGSTRGRSADIFSLGAVFLEMLIASSCPEQRSELARVLQSKHPPSYAAAIDDVHRWMEDLGQKLKDKWQLIILGSCREMLSAERDMRPLSQTIVSEFRFLPSLGHCECVGDDPTNEDLLVEACKAGNIQKVEFLVETKASVQTVGAIHQASVRGSEEIVGMFLARCPSTVDLVDFSGQTALHCAAGNGHKKIVEMLLSTQAKTTCSLKDDQGQTALHCAAAYGIEEIANEMVAMLLERGSADASAKDNDGRTVLHFAARRGHSQLARKLLSRYNVKVDDADSKGRTALHFAAGQGCRDTVQLLLDNSAEVDNLDYSQESTPLHFAAKGKKAHGQYEAVVKLLLKYGADCTHADIKRRTALHFAAENGAAELVSILLGSDGMLVDLQDEDGFTALHYAVKGNTVAEKCEVVERLVEKMEERVVMKKDHREKRTALHFAAESGSEKVVEILLSKHPDVNLQDRSKSTALHYSAKGESKEGRYDEVIRQLLSKNADTSVEDSNRKTALSYARETRAQILREAQEEKGNSSTLLATTEFTNTATIQSRCYDLASFLAVSQSRKMDIVPITWQHQLGQLGAGASGLINQSFINVWTSLAFKRYQTTEFPLGETCSEMPPVALPPRSGSCENHGFASRRILWTCWGYVGRQRAMMESYVHSCCTSSTRYKSRPAVIGHQVLTTRY
jgi:ankyrin repeat protein